VSGRLVKNYGAVVALGEDAGEEHGVVVGVQG